MIHPTAGAGGAVTHVWAAGLENAHIRMIEPIVTRKYELGLSFLPGFT